ncbi:chromosomal replication initiator protein DnaA [Pseudoruegeria sp. SK021]|uniref:chromosomal replication initiator protein DnaA n=1 Tax=Pseudoruegeria sp. SK021 TaxID=1933035 RepID=UPI000A218438|nr:chromosomal replication initiator protein DnaA [Pseudoruegeria sp. SK021]OSP54731.1 chromosomal replication initiation protein DnaA [Pseudoruegeria sp. SK021]
MTNDTWGEVQDALLKSMGEDNYKTWIRPLKFDACENGVAMFNVPTNFIGTWVNRNYGDQILRHLHKAGADVRRIQFEVSTEPRRRESPAAAPDQPAAAAAPTSAISAPAQPAADRVASAMIQPASEASGDNQLPGGSLDQRFTFDSFVVGPPNELAHAAARRVAEGGPVTFNPLFLYGGVGLGKTHLMHAIAWQMRLRDPELRIVYLSAEQFMYRFVQALRDRDMMTFKQLFRSVDVLMVDDVQFIAGKDSTQDEFFHTFNALVDQQKQIIISGDRAPGEMKDMEDRIKSRLQCGLVVDLHPTDYELRLGILQQKVDLYSKQYPSLAIANGVLEFLAHRISTNVRVLEGALLRLFAMASLVGREITLEMTQDCLSDILRVSERKVTVEEIQRRVSEHYNIRLSELIGPTRVRTVARPRQIAMYLCKTLTSRSLPEIGRRFGGRDHTTIMHGVKRIEELKGKDSQVAEDLELLRRSLEA